MASWFVVTCRGWLTGSLVLPAATNSVAQSSSLVLPAPVEAAVSNTVRPASSVRLSTLRSLEPLRESTPTAILFVGDPLREVVKKMWAGSPTFRRQCARLAGSPASVTVRLRLFRDKSLRGLSRLEVVGGALRHAEVVIDGRHRRDLVELIAHELEHVIEQLDGVDLASHVKRGAAKRLSAGRFETARAVQVGQRVADDVRRVEEPPREVRGAGTR